MKVLLDACVWGGAKRQLQDAGHDVVWAGDWPQDPGDEEILARARRELRVLVTLDKDFGELAIVRGAPHCGIIRLVDVSARQQGQLCAALLQKYARELESGAIITGDDRRVRVRT
jgi:predicted nuclease of predicted toxin-antitoxin system